MRVLQRKTDAQQKPQFCENEPEANKLWWLEFDGSRVIPCTLIKENNRGWSFVSYLLGSGSTNIFCSRGEYEMIETKKIKNLKN